ncbi:hypothetical protein [Haliangium sp. UPWRP_2]|uniref:hypothetical protein n=1 Tax=Haliangium sp. UPWRP_2 TaxID=1931276 RepID=UPI0011B23E7A|nr:hypothetical protein [Haliangium sp. UPWRP_2]
MIPALPILERARLYAGLSGSSYNPRLLMTQICEPEIDAAAKESDLAQLEYNATVVHEWSHWFQHHSTSFGAFLSALRYSQQMTTLRFFRELPSVIARKLLERRDSGAAPILALDPVNQYPVFENDKDLDIFRQIWYDHQWVHTSLDDGLNLKRTGIPSPSVFGEIISDVMLSLCLDGNFVTRYRNDLENHVKDARRWYEFQGGITIVDFNGTWITSRLIMETAATIAEMDLLPGTIWSRVLSEDGATYWNRRIRRLLDSDYGVPFRAFLAHVGHQPKELAELLPTLSCICFIALNPPLPPFQLGPPSNGLSFLWADINPPHRFMRLISKVKHAGFLRRYASNDEFFDYLKKLTELSNLPTIIDGNYPDRSKGYGSIDFFDPNVQYNRSTPASYHDYIFWVQHQLSNKRKDSLPLLVSLGQCHSGDYIKKFGDILLPCATDLERVPYVRCPLHWTRNQKIGFTCRRDFGTWLVRQIALYENLFDAIVGTKEYSLSMFPPDVADDSILMNSVKAGLYRALAEIRNT